MTRVDRIALRARPVTGMGWSGRAASSPATGRPDEPPAWRPRPRRTTMRYDRARKNLDRHPNYVLALTWPPAP